MLLQLPDEFFRVVVGEELPPPGAYGVASCFLPRGDAERRAELEQILEAAVEAEGQRVLGWRDVPMELDAGRRHGARGRADRAPARRRRLGRARRATATRSSASCT